MKFIENSVQTFRNDSARIWAILVAGIECVCTRRFASSNDSCALRERSCSNSIGQMPLKMKAPRHSQLSELLLFSYIVHVHYLQLKWTPNSPKPIFAYLILD
jgi:hypothetical protein